MIGQIPARCRSATSFGPVGDQDSVGLMEFGLYRSIFSNNSVYDLCSMRKDFCSSCMLHGKFKFSNDISIGSNPSTTLWRSTKMARPEERNSKVRDGWGSWGRNVPLPTSYTGVWGAL